MSSQLHLKLESTLSFHLNTEFKPRVQRLIELTQLVKTYIEYTSVSQSVGCNPAMGRRKIKPDRDKNCKNKKMFFDIIKLVKSLGSEDIFSICFTYIIILQFLCMKEINNTILILKNIICK